MLDKLPAGVTIKLIDCKLYGENVLINSDFVLGKSITISDEDKSKVVLQVTQNP